MAISRYRLEVEDGLYSRSSLGRQWKGSEVVPCYVRVGNLDQDLVRQKMYQVHVTPDFSGGDIGTAVSSVVGMLSRASVDEM